MSMTDPSYQMVPVQLRLHDGVLCWTGLLAASSVVRKRRLGIFSHVASLMMSQQTRPAAKLKMVSGHHPTGGVLKVDLPPPGFIRSAGTREYRWPMLWSWQKTDCFGDKSQRRDAMAERYALWWWWWWWWWWWCYSSVIPLGIWPGAIPENQSIEQKSKVVYIYLLYHRCTSALIHHLWTGCYNLATGCYH